MKTSALILIGFLACVSAAAEKEKKPIFPEPKAVAKFTEVQVVVPHDPNIVPADVESRLRWRTERELTSRDEPNFKAGEKGLVVELKLLHYIEPKEPFPPLRMQHTVPDAKAPRGRAIIPPAAEPVPLPGVGSARTQFTFKSPGGTILAQFDFVDTVKLRREQDAETSWLPRAAKIAAEYARYYFLEKSPAK